VFNAPRGRPGVFPLDDTSQSRTHVADGAVEELVRDERRQHVARVLVGQSTSPPHKRASHRDILRAYFRAGAGGLLGPARTGRTSS
jgi:hypothetical protein